MKIAWKPQPGKQLQMITATAFEVLCGGARGGTKTESGLAWLALPAHIPQYTGLVLRQTATDLKAWVRRARRFYAPMGVQVKGSPPEIHFPLGGVIFTGHLRDRDAVGKYIGGEFQRILIEELTLIPEEETYEMLIGSARSTIKGLPAQVMTNTNPGGPGHVWVQNRWHIQGKPPYSNKVFVENGRTRQFIHSTIEDNPILKQTDPNYIKTIEGIKDEALRRAWRYGDWSVFSGQYFRMFSKTIHGIEPFEIPGNWDFWGGLDYGEENATAMGIYTRDSVSDRIIRIAEYYKDADDFTANPTATTHAKGCFDMIKSFKYGNLKIEEIPIYADPSMWIERKLSPGQSAYSAAEVFKQHGFDLRPASNDRVPGWRICKELLSYNSGENPKFAYFIGENPAFERYLPMQIHAKNNVEDVLKSKVDHVADEWRYAMMMGAGDESVPLADMYESLNSGYSSNSVMGTAF